MAEADSTPCCSHCGQRIAPRINKTTGLPSKVVRRFCGNRCIRAARDARRGPRKRSRPRFTKPAKCFVCGKAFGSYLSGGAWTQCCDHRCARIARRIRDGSLARKSLVVVSTYRGHCAGCGKRFSSRRKGLLYCTKECCPGYEWKPAERECLGCGATFRQEAKWQQRCSPTCRTEAGRRAKRQAKARRRALERGALADQIDPIKVFERDRWRCHMCGRKTDKAKRGTPSWDAPELDHMVTLADGGTHTWGNVACSCRRCNHAKGAQSFGQLGMNFAA